MNIYSIVLFFHIAGAIGFFVVQGVEWLGLSQIRSAQYTDDARAVMGLLKRTDLLGGISMGTAILTGVYMTLTVWKGVPWILVVIGALLLEFVLFAALARPRVAAIGKALTGENGPLSPTFHNLANDPFLWISIHTRTAILVGIVALKIAKPDLGGSLLTIAVAIAAGLAYVLPFLQREREQVGRADRVIVALLVTAVVAASLLLAAKTISASIASIPLIRAKYEEQDGQTNPAVVPTEPGSADVSIRTTAPASETTLQEQGQALLQDRCTECHSLEKVIEGQKTRPQWEKTLARMKFYRVKLSDAEENLLLEYLSADSPAK